MNSKNQILTIELSELNSVRGANLDTEVKSIKYLNARGQVETISLWRNLFDTKLHIKKTKVQFILATAFIFFGLIICFLILWRCHYHIEIIEDQNEFKNEILFNVIKAIFLFILLQQMFSIWCFLFINL